MMKKITLLLTFIFSLNLIYAYHDISSCTVIDDAFLAGDNEVRLTLDIPNSVTPNCMDIQANNVIFDCQGNTIDGDDAVDYGVYLYRTSAQTTNVTIKNCQFTDWDNSAIYMRYANENNILNSTFFSNPDYGINMYYSNYNDILDINFTDTRYPVRIERSDYNLVKDSFSFGHDYGFKLYEGSDYNIFQNVLAVGKFVGFDLDSYQVSSYGNQLINVTALNHTGIAWGYGLQIDSYFNTTIINSTFKNSKTKDISMGSSIVCETYMENIISSNDMPVGYYNSNSFNVANKEFNILFLCDADDSIFTNISIKSHPLYENGFMSVGYTDRTHFENLELFDTYRGVSFFESNNNTIINSSASSNIQYSSVYNLQNSNGNYFTDISIIDSVYGFNIRSSDNNSFRDMYMFDNSYPGVNIYESNYNYFDNVTMISNNVGFNLWDSSHLTINNSLIMGGGNGLNLQGNNDYTSVLNTIIKDNTYADVLISKDSDLICKDNYYNVTGTGGYPISYYNDTFISLSDMRFSELIICGADNSNFNNITIDGGTSLRNNGLYVFKMNYSNFTNFYLFDNNFGVSIFDLFYNVFDSFNMVNNSYTVSSNYFVEHNVFTNIDSNRGTFTSSGSFSYNILDNISINNSGFIIYDGIYNSFNNLKSFNSVNYGIYFDYYAGNNNISNSLITFSSREGLKIYSDYNNIVNVSIIESLSEGIVMSSAEYNSIINSTIVGNHLEGVRMYGVDYNSFEGNIIKYNEQEDIYVFRVRV